MKKSIQPIVRRLNTLVNNIQRLELTPCQFDELVQISNRFNVLFEFDVDKGNHTITYSELADILGITKYCTQMYMSHFNFTRFRMETRKGKENLVRINDQFVSIMSEYLYLKRRYEAVRNLRNYYIDYLENL